MPPLAVTLSTPPSVAPPALVARASVSEPLKVVTMFPNLSSATTTRPNALPALTLPGGCVVTTNCVAGAAATVKGLVSAPLSPLPETSIVSPDPAR